jgi:hypothetical protein
MTTRTLKAPLAALAVACLSAGAALAGEAVKTETRVFHQVFPIRGGALRLANLCGTIELVPSRGPEAEVEVMVHAAAEDAAETQALLAAMKWVESHDRKGRPEWALSYPVDRYKAFAYPRKGHGGWGWEDSRSTLEYRGHRVAIHSRPKAGAPVLFADLKIWLPSGGPISVRNGAGRVHGGDLAGDLSVDTGSGEVELASFNGKLLVDTGSGDISVGEAKGEASLDTGSGDVRLDLLLGTATIDTGSGDIEVKRLTGGDFSADTGSGTVRLGSGLAKVVTVDTGSGDILVDGLELETFQGDTGSGDVLLRSTLAQTKDILVDTGSGSVRILGGPHASFDLEADQGSGAMVVGYTDAQLKMKGREVYGARRGDGRTRIRIATGSGDCTIEPKSDEPR